MSVIIAVDNPKDWPLAIPGVAIVAARAYLTDPAYGSERVAQVCNLCKSYRYQSLGYYVSLQAEARGHKPLPRVSAIGDLQSQDQIRLMTAGLDKLIAKRPLFVCKYHMVPGHWQIIRHELERNAYEDGATEALSMEDAPPQVIRLALKAANLIGNGFYGVDIKQLGSRYCVIEVNDNPNVDAGAEDGALKDALYLEVMSVFARRMAARRQCLP